MDTPPPPPPPPITAEILRASWRHWLRMTNPSAGPRWLQLVWTALFSASLAVGFTLVGFAINARTIADWLNLHDWLLWYGRNLAVSLIIGFLIQGLFMVARLALGLPRISAIVGWRRFAFFSGIPLLGTLLGWPLGVSLLSGDLSVLRRMTAANVVSLVVCVAMTFAVISSWFALRHRELLAEMRATDARMRLLQGQMEPHFLFNTLANVISLIDADAAGAKQMLEALTEYLRASIGSLRRSDSSVAAELELATCYLQLMRTRMGERLRFEFDVPPELRGAALPPLLLQPLIENAIKHGLEPQVAGGTVRVRGRVVDLQGLAAIELCVEDDGIGLAAATARARKGAARASDGNGIALANLRERLQALFGAGATLVLTDLAPAVGTRTCLVLPLRPGATPAPRDH